MRKVVHLLDDLNLRMLGDLAGSPLDALEVAFGDYAGSLSRWAQGIDTVPVLPPTVQPTLEETHCSRGMQASIAGFANARFSMKIRLG